jgi:hypothetical protein
MTDADGAGVVVDVRLAGDDAIDVRLAGNEVDELTGVTCVCARQRRACSLAAMDGGGVRVQQGGGVLRCSAAACYDGDCVC